MPRTTAILIGVALLGAAAFLAAEVADLVPLRLVAKPLPILALAAILLRRGSGAANGPPDATARWVAAGLVASAVGDVVLDASPALFLAGLGAFLCAHLLYIVAFVREARAPRPWLLLPFALSFGAFLVLLWPRLGDMTLPVAVYCAVITVMVWRAAARLGRTGRSRRDERLGLAGAVSFAISDALIAVNLFYRDSPAPQIGLAIMILYWAGQAGITASVARPAPASASPAEGSRDAP